MIKIIPASLYEHCLVVSHDFFGKRDDIKETLKTLRERFTWKTSTIDTRLNLKTSALKDAIRQIISNHIAIIPDDYQVKSIGLIEVLAYQAENVIIDLRDEETRKLLDTSYYVNKRINWRGIDYEIVGTVPYLDSDPNSRLILFDEKNYIHVLLYDVLDDLVKNKSFFVENTNKRLSETESSVPVVVETNTYEIITEAAFIPFQEITPSDEYKPLFTLVSQSSWFKYEETDSDVIDAMLRVWRDFPRFYSPENGTGNYEIFLPCTTKEDYALCPGHLYIDSDCKLTRLVVVDCNADASLAISDEFYFRLKVVTARATAVTPMVLGDNGVLHNDLERKDWVNKLAVMKQRLSHDWVTITLLRSAYGDIEQFVAYVNQEYVNFDRHYGKDGFLSCLGEVLRNADESIEFVLWANGMRYSKEFSNRVWKKEVAYMRSWTGNKAFLIRAIANLTEQQFLELVHLVNTAKSSHSLN